MPYNADILNRLDLLSESQSEILNNFAAIESLLQQDHEDFNIADAGKHKKLTFPAQAAIPTPSAQDALFFSELDTHQIPQIFFHNGAFLNFWSATGLFYITSGVNTAGEYMLPSGILIKWITLSSINTNDTQTISWATGPDRIPFSAQYWAMVQVGADINNQSKDVNAIAYVTDVSDPASISFNIWRRNQFNLPGTNQNPISISIFAIGIP